MDPHAVCLGDAVNVEMKKSSLVTSKKKHIENYMTACVNWIRKSNIAGMKNTKVITQFTVIDHHEPCGSALYASVVFRSLLTDSDT